MRSKSIIVLAFILSIIVAGCVNEKRAGDTVETIRVGENIGVLFETCGAGTVEGHEGILLEDVVSSSGISNPEAYTYTFVGSDGYQKTVTWADVEKGIMTREGMIIFPHLPKMYMVRDVVEVQVNG